MPHIMLSYCHADKDIVQKLRDEFKKIGYDVWVDWEQMNDSESILDGMAEAVEGSWMVVIIYSENYQNSENCKAEASYARQTKKKLSFVRAQKGYAPKKWLGLMQGQALYYDMSGKYPFEDKFNELAAKVAALSKACGVEATADPPPPLPEPEVQPLVTSVTVTPETVTPEVAAKDDFEVTDMMRVMLMLGGGNTKEKAGTDRIVPLLFNSNGEVNKARLENRANLEKLPAPLTQCKAVALRQVVEGQITTKIYVCGGRDPTGAPVKSTYIYCVNKDEWTKGPDMLHERSMFGLAADHINGIIYAVGGGRDDSVGKSVEYLKAGEEGTAWIEMPQKTNKLRNPCNAMIKPNADGKSELIIIGGGFPDHKSTEYLCLDNVAAGWTNVGDTVESPMVATPFIVGKALFILTASTVERYDDGSKTWSKVITVPYRRGYAGGALIADKLFYWGGQAMDHNTGFAYVYDTVEEAWLEEAAPGDAGEMFPDNSEAPCDYAFVYIHLPSDDIKQGPEEE